MIGMLLRSKLLMPLLVIGVAFFGWFLHRRSEDSGDFWETSINGSSGIASTISMEQAKFFARDLYDAMKILGTKEDDIKKVTELCNPEDWRLVHNSFGQKRYFMTGNHDVFGLKKDLREWLKSELSLKKDKPLINRIKYLYEANGVNF